MAPALDESEQNTSAVPPCPLCHTSATDLYHVAEESRDYFKCPECALIYLHPAQRLSLQREQERYALHRNDAADPEYIRFLERIAVPVIERLRPGARGIDFGCGPAPVLSELLVAAGFPCVAYDPLFASATALLSERYDFVTCSEVIEHAHDPSELFATLGRLLLPGGLLGVMTQFYGHEAPFTTWWYRRDPTHVSFYCEATMTWIANKHGWAVKFPRPTVALFAVPKP